MAFSIVTADGKTHDIYFKVLEFLLMLNSSDVPFYL